MPFRAQKGGNLVLGLPGSTFSVISLLLASCSIAQVHIVFFLLLLLFEVRGCSLRVSALSEYGSLEALKCNHDHCHIVETLPIERAFKDAFDSQTALLVHILGKLLLLKLLWGATVPHALIHIFIRQLVIDSVTCQQNVVVLLRYLEASYIWGGHHDLWVASLVFKLSFCISKGS